MRLRRYSPPGSMALRGAGCVVLVSSFICAFASTCRAEDSLGEGVLDAAIGVGVVGAAVSVVLALSNAYDLRAERPDKSTAVVGIVVGGATATWGAGILGYTEDSEKADTWGTAIIISGITAVTLSVINLSRGQNQSSDTTSGSLRLLPFARPATTFGIQMNVQF